MRQGGAVATRIVNEVKGVNRVVYDVEAARPDRVGVSWRDFQDRAD